MKIIYNQMWTVMLTAKMIQTQTIVKRKNQGIKKNVPNAILISIQTYFIIIGSEQKASENLKSLFPKCNIAVFNA